VASLRILNTYPLPAAAVTAISAIPGVTISAPADASGVTVADLAEVDALWGELPAGGLASAPRLRWMARAGAGVEDLDLAGLTGRGVLVTNASGLHASSMGEYVLGAMLFAFQHQAARVDLQRAHRWDPQVAWADPLRGRTVAILGYGSIGREVARLADAFGMRVLALKLRPDQRHDDGYMAPGTGDPEGRIPERIAGLGELPAVLGEADVIVIALPLTPETRGILGRAALAACRPGAWIVNVGRGPMIDESALVDALRAGRLGGAYLDVFDEEPLPAGHPYWDTPNLFVSPHIAGVNSYERYWQMLGGLLEENARRLLAGQPLLNTIDPVRAY
jgi:phosphoglycerate dehydrogenase-like enzyme